MSLLQDEQESWRLLLDEAQREGEFEMSIQHINRLQEEADSAYNRVPQSEAAAWAQVIAQCEIALQQADINEHLATQNEQRDTQNAVLLRIAIAIEALNPGR